ncbi:MAG: hypothetical protein ACOZCO_15325 [Bacteroidota bacterium]
MMSKIADLYKKEVNSTNIKFHAVRQEVIDRDCDPLTSLDIETIRNNFLKTWNEKFISCQTKTDKDLLVLEITDLSRYLESGEVWDIRPYNNYEASKSLRHLCVLIVVEINNFLEAIDEDKVIEEKVEVENVNQKKVDIENVNEEKSDVKKIKVKLPLVLDTHESCLKQEEWVLFLHYMKKRGYFHSKTRQGMIAKMISRITGFSEGELEKHLSKSLIKDISENKEIIEGLSYKLNALISDIKSPK